jgi:hypothetical protein
MNYIKFVHIPNIDLHYLITHKLFFFHNYKLYTSLIIAH